VHPHRYLLGPAVSGSAGAGGFSRPRFNGPGFRQNDAVARDLLTVALAARTAPAHLGGTSSIRPPRLAPVHPRDHDHEQNHARDTRKKDHRHAS
jgi:hypothetical protein